MKYFVVASLAWLVTACGSVNDNIIPPTELKAFEASLDVNEVWDVDAGSGNDGEYLLLEPLILVDRMVTIDIDGKASAFGLENGDRLWSSNVDQSVVAGVGGGAGVALVGTKEGALIALDSDSGQQLWKQDLRGQALSISEADSGLAVVRLTGGRVIGVSLKDGSRTWSFDREQPSLTLQSQGKPLTAHGGVALGMDDGTVVMLQLRTGNPIWESVLATGRGRTELDRLVDVDGNLVLSGEALFAVSYQGKVASIDARSGRLLWAKDASSSTGVTVDDRAVYFTDDKDVVHALSRNTGIELWSQEGLKHRRVTRPADAGSALVVADYDGYLHWLDKRSGNFIQRKRASSSGILLAPKRVNDKLAVQADDGKLSIWSTGASR